MSKYVRMFAGAVALTFGVQGVAPAYGDQVPPKVQTMSPTGVNLSEGAWNYEHSDLSIGSLQLERFLMNTVTDPLTPFFGPHISHSFDIYLARTFVPTTQFFPQHNTYVVHLGNGASGMYTDSGGTIHSGSSEGNKGYLQLVGSAYVYTDQSGTIYSFNPAVAAAGANKKGVNLTQRIASIMYQNGRLLTFSYNGSGQLKLVTDNGGYAIVFDYAANGNVSAACGFNLSQTSVSTSSTCTGATLKVTYGYTGSVLTSVTDVMGYTTNLESGGYCIKPPGYSVCKINVSAGGEVDSVMRTTSQVFADGSTWNFIYEGDFANLRDESYVPSESSYTEMIDPNGKHSFYYFTKSTINSVVDANGNTTLYNFLGAPTYETINPLPNSGHQLDTVTAPEGNIYKENRNARQLVTKRTWKAKPGSGLPDIVEDTGYNTCPTATPSLYCTQPLWVKDGRGNQTDYTLDAVHGGVLTATLPDDASGNRTRTYTTYASFNTGSGTIYRPVRTETCSLTPAQLTLTACPALVTTSVTLTAYGDATNSPNTYKGFQPYQVTQTDGAATLSATVTYGYDAYGNAIWVDGPLAGDIDRVFKTYDLQRRVVCEIGADPDGAGALVRAMIRHTYDAPGRETLTETGTGTSTTTCIGTAMTVAAFTRTTYDLVDRVTKTEVGVP